MLLYESINICEYVLTCGAFLVKDDRVLKGPLGRSLRSFACTAHSAHSLCSAPLCYARFATLASLWTLCSLALFTGSLTHFAHSLMGQLEFLNMCSHCYRVSREQTRFWRSLETRPNHVRTKLTTKLSWSAQAISQSRMSLSWEDIFQVMISSFVLKLL